MKKLDAKSVVLGVVAGVCALAVLGASTGSGSMFTATAGRYALFTCDWPSMREVRLQGSFHPVGLFRIDTFEGTVWALTAETDRLIDIKGWVPIGEPALGVEPQPQP